MASQTHHRSGAPGDWFEDVAFLVLLFSAVAVVATIIALLIAL